jgi:hypothetical protein
MTIKVNRLTRFREGPAAAIVGRVAVARLL